MLYFSQGNLRDKSGAESGVESGQSFRMETDATVLRSLFMKAIIGTENHAPLVYMVNDANPTNILSRFCNFKPKLEGSLMFYHLLLPTRKALQSRYHILPPCPL
jgi:hypothetical protein